ncbi:23S rRNA (adenine(2503)-C(2))-methyltransferase RlmN [bacterium]|nr:23S rRNA (adenine(2503)-C(2))-methyltransferase RlmN [candidate division CSSED10-310 bacterium]
MKLKQSILNLTLNELQQWVATAGEPAFRATQIFDWIYDKRMYDFDGMTNLSIGFRKKLASAFHVLDFSVSNRQESVDGSVKYAFRLQDDGIIETVHMPSDNYDTLCISSQSGCALGCRFCATAQLGIHRNLTVSEIISQVLHSHSDVNRRCNLVFMGMGEPLLNSENVFRSIDIMTGKWGLGWSSRRITLSTCGIVPEIERLVEKGLDVNLAISLNAADDKTRNRLMPINRKYPLKLLMQCLSDYVFKTRKTRVTFEYIMIKNINDSDETAKKLTKLLNKTHSKINLIPLNPVKATRYNPSDSERILAFQKILSDAGFLVRIRQSRGSDILAACGQLAGDSLNKSEEI